MGEENGEMEGQAREERGERGEMQQLVREEMKGQMELWKEVVKTTIRAEMEERERERVAKLRKKRGTAVCIE